MSCAIPTLFPTGVADFVAPRPLAVTIGNYFKHLMLYKDGRFARHPRFRYFALNTEMRWRALQAGRIYVHQHPHDAQLSIEELRDMVGREGEAFSNRVLHYATSLRGTRQYWFKQRSRLIAMVDTLGLPTVFFTHSAADLQWPELARLICPDNPDSSSSRSKALQENPAIADWFFHHRIQKFVDAFYVGVLGATDFWLRYEWQHRGSPHVHGLAWLPDAPNVEQVLASSDADTDAAKEALIQHVDNIVSTTNPSLLLDGSNAEDAPPPKTNPHICNFPYAEVEDFDQDLADLIATCQRHTRCSAAYCLRTRNGQQKCRFDYPKPLQSESALVTEEWMLICQRNADLQPNADSQEDIDWTRAAQVYPNLEEMPTFLSRQRDSAAEHSFTTFADPQRLQGKQLQAYTLVRQHAEAEAPPPLRMIVSGTAGTGKSYLIHCLRLILNNRLHVASPTGVAAFNIEGYTLHSLLSLPVKGDYKDLEGERLHRCNNHWQTWSTSS